MFQTFPTAFRVAALGVAAAGAWPASVLALTTPVVPPNGTLAFSWDAGDPGNNAAQWQAHVNGPKPLLLGGGAAAPTLNAGSVSSIQGITNSFSFDGVNDTMSTADQFLNNNAPNLSNNDASFEVWFKPTQYNGTNKGVLFETGGSGTGMALLFDAATNEVIYAVKDGGTGPAFTNDRAVLSYSIATSGPTASNTSEFIQVVGTYDKDSGGATDILTLYINGNAVVASNNANTSIDDWDGGNGTGVGSIGNGNIGADTGNPGVFENAGFSTFDGEIAIVRVYSNAVGGPGIQNNYDAVYGVTPGAVVNLNADTDIDGDGTWNDTLNLRPATLPAGSTRVGGPNGSSADVSQAQHLNFAYTFDGTGAAQTNFDGLASSGNMTTEIWFKPADLDTGTSGADQRGEILWETGGINGSSFTLVDSVLTWAVANGGTQGRIDFDITGLDGEFIQAVGTYDDATSEISLFINGAFVGSIDPGTIGDWSGGDPAALGGQGGANLGGFGNGFANFSGVDYEGFHGQIAKFRLYNDLLTSDEIRQNFQAVFVIPEPATGLMALLAAGALGRRRRRA